MATLGTLNNFSAGGFTRGVDTSATVNASQAKALYAAGLRFIVGIVGLPSASASHNATPEALKDWTDAGLAVMLYGYFRSDGWNAATGAEDAIRDVQGAKVAGYVPGAVLWTDIEGDFSKTATADLIAYCIARIRETHAGGYKAGGYIGRCPLSPAQLTAIGFDFLWHSGMDGTPDPLGPAHWSLVQDRAVPGVTMNVTIGGVVVDTDVVVAGDLPVHVGDAAPVQAPAPPTGPSGGLPGWLQALRDGQPGDTPGAKVWRAVKAFEGVALHVPGGLDKLAALAGMDNPPGDARQYAQETTNCATTMRWILSLVGCPSNFVTQPDKPGVSMGWDLLAAQQYGALIPLKSDLYPTGGTGQPDAWKKAGVGWGLHYGMPGTNDDHVEWLGSVPDPNTGVATHGGGGRADNAITIETGDIRWSMGRPLLHVIDIDRMHIPTLPAEIPGPVGTPFRGEGPTGANGPAEPPPGAVLTGSTKASGTAWAPLALAIWGALAAIVTIAWHACSH